MRTYKVTRGPHYDVDTTIPVPELTRNRFYILFPAKGVINYRQIISSRLSRSYQSILAVYGIRSLARRALKQQ